MFLNNNKRKIAFFVLFFFLFSFPIKVQESYANPLAYEFVAWGLAAVLTAAGISVETGDTNSLLIAVQDYYDSLKEPEKAMYERMALEAHDRGNAALSDQLWNSANRYVKSKYIEGTNVFISDVPVPDGLIIEDGYNIVADFGNLVVTCKYGTTYYWHEYEDYYYNYYYKYYILVNNNWIPNISGSTGTLVGYTPYYALSDGKYYLFVWGKDSSSSPAVPKRRTPALPDQYIIQDSIIFPNENVINFNSVMPDEFQFSTPVPPGTVPERRIAFPSHVFNPNNDIEQVLAPLTGKTAQDIWGAAGAYTANTTTFDPVSGDNPILPWVPIADPSTFTPAGELPAEIIANAPGVLDGTNSDLNSISGSLGSIWDILKTGFNALIDTIWTGISHLLDGLGSISLLLKSVFDLINSGISAIVGAISSIWDLVYDGFASVATALRGILDQVANVAGYLNPASDTFFLRTALVPDVAVLNGFVESLNINFQEKFQIAAAYEEFQSYKDTDHESEFEDIYVDLPIWGMQCICKGEFVNTAGQQFKSVVAAFLIMLTVIFCFKRIATIGSK